MHDTGTKTFLRYKGETIPAHCKLKKNCVGMYEVYEDLYYTSRHAF